MEKIITGLLLVIAIIHWLPITGMLGLERLESLYGVNIASDDLAILMRHRAVLFGLLGAFFTYAAFKPSLQPLAFIAAFVSIATFLFFAFTAGTYNTAIRKVVIANIIAAICWGVAVILYLKTQFFDVPS